jgi:pimeloyl-ACP methyl ester carboxylesterase
MHFRWVPLTLATLFVAACSGSDRSPTAIDSSSSGSTAASTSAPTTGTETVNETGTLDWAPCAEQKTPLAATECATLPVPLDHAAPDGEMIDIAVARVVASDPSNRIGSLVFNPGGPGGSGIEFLTQAAATMPIEVAQRFDLVGFDPRGVAASTAVDCENDLDDNVPLLASDDDPAWQVLLDDSAELVASCTPETARIGAFVGTNSAARDLDLLREALGDEGLTYVGYSYGTRLGATYAELFPAKVRALVLDGAVKPTTDFTELGAGQADGFDRALENFAAACDADEECLLRELGPTLDVLTTVRSEIAEVGEFPADDAGRVLTPGELDLGVVSALYSKDSWPFLAEAIYLAETNQDGSLFQVLADNYLGRSPDATYNNSQLANLFINCADNAVRPDVDVVRAENDATGSKSVYFADLLRASTGCIGLPDPIDPLLIGPAANAAPILVIGNTGDPATPYEWSQEMAAYLDSGVLYTVEAEGHTAFGSIDCVAEPVGAYLIELAVPADGSTCSDNATADFFVPTGDTDVGRVIALFDCLRNNGVDVPEIGTAEILADPTGETFLEILDPNNPAVAEAFGACSAELLDLQDG